MTGKLQELSCLLHSDCPILVLPNLCSLSLSLSLLWCSHLKFFWTIWEKAAGSLSYHPVYPVCMFTKTLSLITIIQPSNQKINSDTLRPCEHFIQWCPNNPRSYPGIYTKFSCHVFSSLLQSGKVPWSFLIFYDLDSFK